MQAGLPIVRSIKSRWSLERQVRLGAGVLVLIGAILTLTVSSRWLFLAAFIGLGLTCAGLTDICPMAGILGRMPWNKTAHCKNPAPESGSLTESPVTTVTARATVCCENVLMPLDASRPEPSDFDALTRQHKDAVYRQMIRAGGNREDAEDVLVEALLRAYRHLKSVARFRGVPRLARPDRQARLLAA